MPRIKQILQRIFNSSLLSTKNQRGQHVVEYTVLVSLVIAGIIITSPYIIRSWHAHVKGYDDSVQDSFNDPLIECRGSDCVNFEEECICEPNPLHCGSGNAGNCSQIEMQTDHSCNFLGCKVPDIECNRNPGCCQIIPFAAPEFCGEAGGNCPDEPCGQGEICARRICGDIPADIENANDCFKPENEGRCPFTLECIAEPDCEFGCKGSLPPAFKTKSPNPFCEGDDQLTNVNVAITTVDECEENGTFCEVECKLPFVASGRDGSVFTDCRCPEGTYELDEDCVPYCTPLPKIEGCTTYDFDDDNFSDVIRYFTFRCPSGTEEIGRTCTGNCNGHDSRVVYCCPETEVTFDCEILSSDDDEDYPECSPGKKTWFEYCEGNCDDDDAKLRFCCAEDSLLPECRAIPVEELETYGECDSNEYEMMRNCTENCDHDDAKFTYCCTEGESAECRGAEALFAMNKTWHPRVICVLRPDGNVDCNGDMLNEDYIGALGEKAIDIAASEYSRCAVLQNGNIYCWSKDTAGVFSSEYLYTGGDAVNISAGSDFYCFIKKDLTVECHLIGLGPGDIDVLDVVDIDVSDVVDIESGGRYTCVLKLDGTVACWDYGDQIVRTEYSPSGSRVVQMAVHNHKCVVLEDGRVQCWGADKDCESSPFDETYDTACWSTTTERDKRLDRPITTVYEEAQQVVVSARSTCVLDKKGDVRCWGWNISSKLSGFPPVAKGSSVGDLNARGWETYVLSDDCTRGSVSVTAPCYCNALFYSGNSYQEVGCEHFPTANPVISIGLGGWNVCMAHENGSVRCTGLNSPKSHTTPFSILEPINDARTESYEYQSTPPFY